MRKSKELFFTGDLLSAQDALPWGLINRVVPRADLDAGTLAESSAKTRAEGLVEGFEHLLCPLVHFRPTVTIARI